MLTAAFCLLLGLDVVMIKVLNTLFDENIAFHPRRYPMVSLNSVLMESTTTQRCAEDDSVANSSNLEIDCNQNGESTDSTKSTVYSEKDDSELL